jgi:hypothetical protein
MNLIRVREGLRGGVLASNSAGGLVYLLVLLAACNASAGPAPTNMMPIAVTGWNRDLVIESTAVGPPYTSYASEMNVGENKGFYQTGLAPHAWGMPPSGMFVSLIGDYTIFQFQPYNANNALVLSSDTGLTSGTLTLVTPATYSQIAVVAHSGNGTNSTGPITFNFSDGSSYTTTYNAPDWFNGTNNVALFGPGRILVTTGVEDGGLQNPRFYQTTINLASLLGVTNKPIASVTFGQSLSKSTAIYAISGQLAAPAAPIAVTGFNRDVVVENTASGPPYSAAAAEFNPGGGTAYYQNGLSGTANGLPKTGAFSSALDGTLFQFQPYAGNNALVFSTETGVASGTLTLVTPALYNSLVILANSANGGGLPNITLNFSDGSSFTTTYDASDWFGNNLPALGGVERINLTSGALSGSPNSPRFYQATLDLIALLGATNKPLASVTFNQVAGAGATAVYALSGVAGAQTGGSIVPATVNNSPATGIGTRTATVQGAISATGGDVPEVLIYYGPADGGSNPANWAQRVWLGTQSGAFAQSLTGLSVNTTYYYTAVAINSAGTTWATPSQTFTTAPASLAAVTNLPAANLTTNSALLSGQVLSLGGDAPTITLYYGPVNGGSTPANWAHSVNLGLQTGRFAQSVVGLTPNITWFFTAQAVNGAGASWASPVGSFVTPATNPPATPLVPVLTWHNDVARTGLNTNETSLTLANVNTNTFGKLFSQALDGYPVTQPLLLPNVTIPGKGVHNVVFMTTEHDSVYAFDADNNSGVNATPLWQVSFANNSSNTYTINVTADLASIAGGFVGPEIGISGTPVIDPVSGTFYVVTSTKEALAGVTNFYNRLHALDVATGAEKFGGPVLIQGSVPGVGDGNDGKGNVPFVQLKHHQRSSLLLLNGMLYIPFTGHFDYPPYHGWVFAYNPYTLAQTGIFNANPNGSDGGFWQSGCGPSADPAGNFYLITGNGNWDSTNFTFGNSVLKFSTTNGLALADWFTPYNQLDLNFRDLDVGSAGQIVPPDSAGSAAHPHLLIAGSKTGTIYLLDRDNMGHFNAAGDTQIVQSVTGAVNGMWCTPAWFNGAFYYIASGDRVKSFSLANGVINPTPLSQGSTTIGSSTPSISANGTANAIVWAMQPSTPAVLHAYNATNLAVELYNSSQNSTRDGLGSPVKFVVPTVANGKVYVGSQNSLTVFGNSSLLALPVITPNGGPFTNSIQVSISNSVPGSTIYYTLDGTTPTTNSLLYTAPFVLTASAGVQAVATMPGSPNSPAALATFYSANALGRGIGLLGQYYGNTLPSNPFIGSPLVRTDAVVNFNWNSNSPDPSMATNNYTVRWTGLVQPIFNELYTFYTTTDDGVRLWVNGQLVIDKWVAQSPTTWSGSLTLQAGQLYSVEMDYFQAQGGALAQLSWSSPSTAQATIPQTQLYPVTTLPPVRFTTAGQFNNGAFSLSLTGMAGGSYILQGTTDFVNWASINTNLAPGNLFNLSDPTATNFHYRFYRAVEQK